MWRLTRAARRGDRTGVRLYTAGEVARLVVRDGVTHILVERATARETLVKHHGFEVQDGEVIPSETPSPTVEPEPNAVANLTAPEEPVVEVTEDALRAMTKAARAEVARSLGIRGRSTMEPDQLVSAILERQRATLSVRR